MKLFILALVSAFSFQAFSGEYTISWKVCRSNKKQISYGVETGLKLETVAQACSTFKEMKKSKANKKLKEYTFNVSEPSVIGLDGNSAINASNDLIALLEELGLNRNYAMEDVRLGFYNALSPGISPEAVRPGKLFKGRVWSCEQHRSFISNDLDGINTNTPNKLKFTVSRNRIKDSDGFAYAYRNGLEFLGNTKDVDFLRAVRMEYWCEDLEPGECNADNFDGITLFIEETRQGQSLLGYIGSFLNIGAGSVKSSKIAAQRLFREASARALNRRTQKACGGINGIFIGCELAINYYECFDNAEDFDSFF